MEISLNWLKKYIDIDLSAQEVATILTDIGLEVEALEKVESIRGGLQGVVVGHVVECWDHPDSDHLHVTKVDVGAQEPLQIVCGAPNCRQGLKVLCATVGSVLYPNGGDEEFKIKRSKIRGVESLGMLCAEDELGIGASHAGIMELPEDAVVGTAARDFLGITDDYLIGIGLTPNRVDAASHIGVARDIAAYLRSQGKDVKVTLPSVDDFSVDNHDMEIEVVVENHDAAPRYAGLTVTGCQIAPSPEWMQKELRAAGINPKNNLVDITNYVLFELGQPLHAFDADKIEGRKVVVKNCAEGTPFVTLDGVERKLSKEDLMICSAERPMCIGGVFGGLDSGISDTTVNVFLESAYFNPVSIRRSAKRHGLSTDASFRFERGIDPNIQVYALKRAALLMRELAGGKISSEITDLNPTPAQDFVFELSLDRVNSLIGKEIPEQTVRTILDALEVKIT
ncbi:MAG: phenylalanine--tRNA ligase subunit beta, partial [Alistipes sp.]|nr:phenylalanine--tRNA ligase subunit beta [Alistipes sp.]